MTSRVASLLGLCALSLLIFVAPARAQEDEASRFALGLAGGMIDTDLGAEPYFTANLRIRAGYRATGEEKQGSVTGFVEPEVAYWSHSDDIQKAKDTMIGVNLGGAVRLRSVEYFIAGGVGYHFLSQDFQTSVRGISHDEGRVGVNAQFGFDILMSETISLFGVGRFDIVQSGDTIIVNNQEVQPQSNYGKAYLGVRFHF